MIVEIKDESILWFIKKPRGTINLLNVVLAVANDTPYTLASLRFVGSVFGMETVTRMRYYILFISYYRKSVTLNHLPNESNSNTSIPKTKPLKHPFYNLIKSSITTILLTKNHHCFNGNHFLNHLFFTISGISES